MSAPQKSGGVGTATCSNPAMRTNAPLSAAQKSGGVETLSDFGFTRLLWMLSERQKERRSWNRAGLQTWPPVGEVGVNRRRAVELERQRYHQRASALEMSRAVELEQVAGTSDVTSQLLVE